MTKHNTMRVSKMILVEVLSQGGRFLRMDPIYSKWYVAPGTVGQNKISYCVREFKRGLIADRRQHPVSRAQVQEEPALGGQPRQETAPREVPFLEILVGHQEHQQMVPSSIVDIKNCQRRNSEPHHATVCDDMHPIWDQQMLPSLIVNVKHCQRRNSEPHHVTVLSSPSMGNMNPHSIFPPEPLQDSTINTPPTVCNEIDPVLSSSLKGYINPAEP